jgi:quercetin dioxygenase-like cupin family protein
MKPLTDFQLADVGVGIAHHFGGGAYIKETRIPCGTELQQHAHEHDHLSYLVSGRVLVTIDGMVWQFDAPQCLVLKAGKFHGVRALTDALWLCVWATDCTDPATVDEAVTSA